MPSTVTATRLGKNKSVARAAPMSTAGPTSIDVMTVNHLLGVTPDDISVVPRTVRVALSGGTPQPVLVSYSATQAIFHLPSLDGGASGGDFDVVIERTHSFVR
jgi:hypothetical protein